VGSLYKLIGAMDARWQRGHVYMIPRQLRRGYGCLLAMKQDEMITSIHGK